MPSRCSRSLIAAVAATVAVLMVGGVALAVIFALINAAPVVFLARQALLQRRNSNQQTEWYPPGLLVMWLAGIATAGVGAGATAGNFIFAGLGGWGCLPGGVSTRGAGDAPIGRAGATRSGRGTGGGTGLTTAAGGVGEGGATRGSLDAGLGGAPILREGSGDDALRSAGGVAATPSSSRTSRCLNDARG